MIPKPLEERILRLHLVEKWKVGTIARQLGVHLGGVLHLWRAEEHARTTSDNLG